MCLAIKYEIATILDRNKLASVTENENLRQVNYPTTDSKNKIEH